MAMNATEEDPDLELEGSKERFHRILYEIENKEIVYADWKDYSVNPSYTNFEVPYHMKCRDRYNRSKERYEAQFQHELEQLLKNQGSAHEAAGFNRHICYTTLWPPFHTRREIRDTQRYFFRLTRKQRQRLNILMSRKIE